MGSRDRMEKIHGGRNQYPSITFNPGRGNGQKTPLCPECEEPIKCVSNDMEQQFVCGCDNLQTFVMGNDNDSDDDDELSATFES